jgi:hypothetical protein
MREEQLKSIEGGNPDKRMPGGGTQVLSFLNADPNAVLPAARKSSLFPSK